MFKKKFDIIAIGDITTDAFIRLKDASVHCKVNTEDCELCMRFGDKIPFQSVKVVRAVGNAANASVCSARLGLRSALITNIGNDENGRECRIELEKNRVDTSLVKTNKGKATNYHFVLWYDKDRTILVNHIPYEYHLPHLPESRWLYLSSLAENTIPYHTEITEYLDKHKEVKLAFQPGTFQLKNGFDKFVRLYSRSDLVVVNVEEAERLLENDSRDIKFLLKSIADHGPKMVIITDNTRGAYFFDGERYYHMPMYPDPREAYERTGCGDAFASTFVSALIMGKSPLEALVWAPVNPMSVAQFIGAQEGLLTREQIEWWLHRAPADFKPREI